jgi:hypothetical protein
MMCCAHDVQGYFQPDVGGKNIPVAEGELSDLAGDQPLFKALYGWYDKDVRPFRTCESAIRRLPSHARVLHAPVPLPQRVRRRPHDSEWQAS